MATLYTHRDANIRKTVFLFAAFCIVVIGIGWVFARIYGDPSLLVLAVLVATGMSVASFWYSDRIVLSMTRAVPVSKGSARDLFTLVENLSITAGLPMPKVFVVHDPAPNAFATGRNPEHAVVAVTTGLLEKLNKTEIEGVLAHELSHIGNRDMLISTVAVVLVGFVSLISDWFLRSTFWGAGGRDRENNQAGAIFMLVGMILAILAPFAAMLMQLAISRKREFLADASGALLTRYPDGLASALEKIATDPAQLRVAQNTTAHLWIADPFKGKKTPVLHKLFMTHPPVEERIRALKGLEV